MKTIIERWQEVFKTADAINEDYKHIGWFSIHDDCWTTIERYEDAENEYDVNVYLEMRIVYDADGVGYSYSKTGRVAGGTGQTDAVMAHQSSDYAEATEEEKDAVIIATEEALFMLRESLVEKTTEVFHMCNQLEADGWRRVA